MQEYGNKPNGEEDYTKESWRVYLQCQFWWKRFMKLGLHRVKKKKLERFNRFMEKGLERANNEQNRRSLHNI